MLVLQYERHESHALVVTKPAPESTTMLDPDVVTPKAANTEVMNVKNVRAHSIARCRDPIAAMLRPSLALAYSLCSLWTSYI